MFAEMHPTARIIPGLLAGRPNHEVTEKQIAEKAFHDELYNHLVEPLAADFRTSPNDGILTRVRRRREATFHLLAVLLGTDK